MADRKAYEAWIAEHYGSREKAMGACIGASAKMAAAFPELRVVKGWVNFGEEHAWCETEGGDVVDPTAAQYDFPPSGYEPWRPGDEVRVGKCMNCGCDIMRAVDSLNESVGDTQFCGEACEASMLRYMNGEEDLQGNRVRHG